ncbi:hypothetical protein KSS87_005657 [Heliosperma pusillum]|nr:hypothetical protein KSS87_005657 [Heliosperma pusillum]
MGDRNNVPNRSNVQQLKMMGQAHPTGLTNNLLKLFAPRPPLEFKPPVEKKKCAPYTGMAQFVKNFAEPGEPEYAPPIKETETPAEKKARIHKLKLEKGVAKVVEDLEKYDPQNDPDATGDPYKTLFVSRLSFETSESRLKKEFETYGPIKRVKMIYDKETNKPKGYAFIEYAHTRDMKAAYKQADGRKIDGRRVLVDVERGRTVPNWRPRRLGGGLGTTRVGVEDVNQRHAVGELQSGGTSRSQEPRVREDRDREKSREKGKEAEKSRERSHDKPRDRDHRDDRRHRDRDRTRDKDMDREHGRDHDRRDRDRGRDRGREYEREKNRDHTRDRDHDKNRGSELVEAEHNGGNSHDRHGERERGYDHSEADNDYHGQTHSELEPDDNHYGRHHTRGHHNRKDADIDRYDRYDNYDDDDHHGQYDRMEEDN